MLKLRNATVAVLVLVGSAVAVQAQMPPPGQGGALMRGPEDGAGSGPMGRGPMPGMMMPMPPLDERLAIAKDELQITEEQMPEWNTLASAFHDAQTKIRAATEGAPDATRTAMMEIDRRVAVLAATLDAAKGVQTAAGPLYDVLSDKQKKIADEMLTKRRRDM